MPRGTEDTSLKEMTGTQACRGPDASAGRAEGTAALGHTRLATVDLIGGRQPMVLGRSGRTVLARIDMGAGEKARLTAADETALEGLGLGDSIDDGGHVQGSADPRGERRAHPHIFGITSAGRKAVTDAALWKSRVWATGHWSLADADAEASAGARSL
ncbi:hypothetical protein [Streptomyces sp. NPDC005283]|uniref:hypothetical protein n=1 Tax=Streptomyces sp. NPDC005283 TaxID=3156871 RepID=UPI00345532F3